MRAFFCTLALVATAAAETVTLTPSQDSDIYKFFDGPSFSIDSLNVGADPSQAHSHHALVQFNLAPLTIPAAEIGSAKLRLFALSPSSSEFGTPRPGLVSVLRQGKAWTVSTLRWSSLDAREQAGTIPIVSTTIEVWVELDVTALAKQWVSGAVPNYGLVLRPADESSGLNTEFATMELSSYKPQLVITRAVAPPVPPVLTVGRVGGQVSVSWPQATSSGWTLQEAESPAGPWTASAAAAASEGGMWKVAETPVAGGRKFFRLNKP